VSDGPARAWPSPNEGHQAGSPQRWPAAPSRVEVDPGYVGLEDAWARPEGTDEVTRKILDLINDPQYPGVRQKLNTDQRLARRAADRLERDEEWSASMGLARSDAQRLRQEIAKGPGWIDRVEGLLGKGLFPAFVAGIGLNEAMSEQP
jgi:hypothetical protein